MRRISGSSFQRASLRGQLRKASKWPLKECLVSKEWRDTTKIVQILISRRGPRGQDAVGTFLVDLGCLGVKNASGYIFTSRRDYKELRNGMARQQELVPADLDLAAKIIREAVAYADSLGFEPHPDFELAKLILGDADPDACNEEIPLGKDGKPFYFSGPYDNVDAIMKKLERAVGPGNFEFTIHLGDPPPDFFG